MGRPSILICNRRADSTWARRVEGELAKRFGSDVLFRERTIPACAHRRSQIDAALDACSVMVVLIGPSWTTPAGPEDSCRQWEGDDVVAHEIERGLQRLDVAVIPVTCGGAAMPAFKQLPPALVGLSDLRALNVSGERWAWDADHLRRCVGLHVPERTRWARRAPPVVRRPANASAQPRSRSGSSATAWSPAR
jgi:hypothetical protein